MAVGNGITSAVGMDADRTIPELAGQPVQSIMSTDSVRDPALKDKVEDKVSQKTPYTSSSLHIHVNMHTHKLYHGTKRKIMHYMYDYRSQENNRREIKDKYCSIHSKRVQVGSSDFGKKMTSSGLLFATYTQ